MVVVEQKLYDMPIHSFHLCIKVTLILQNPLINSTIHESKSEAPSEVLKNLFA